MKPYLQARVLTPTYSAMPIWTLRHNTTQSVTLNSLHQLQWQAPPAKLYPCFWHCSRQIIAAHCEFKETTSEHDWQCRESSSERVNPQPSLLFLCWQEKKEKHLSFIMLPVVRNLPACQASSLEAVCAIENLGQYHLHLQIAGSISLCKTELSFLFFSVKI